MEIFVCNQIWLLQNLNKLGVSTNVLSFCVYKV